MADIKEEESRFSDDWIIKEADSMFPMKASAMRTTLERTWYRNILYYLGEQWISWFVSTGTFGRRYPANLNVPTPVSNIILDYVKEMKSLILNKSYSVRVWPNSSEEADRSAAEMAECVVRHEDIKDNAWAEEVKEDAALWMILTGSGFVRTFLDDDTGRYIAGPDGKGMPAPPEATVDSIIPFNVDAPALGRFLHQKVKVCIKALKYREWVEDTYKVKIQKGEDRLVTDYQRQLYTLVANVSPWKGRGFESASDMDLESEDLVLVKEIEWRPTRQFPKGRHAIVCQGTVCMKESELPIPVNKETGEWYYSLTHFRYNSTPGGFWPVSGVDPLISPQNTINKVDQALEINRRSIGRPFIITPIGLTLKRLSDRGSELLAVEYDAKMSANKKPEIHPGAPYPQQILEERNIHRSVAQDAAGDPKNVLRGHSPHSGASGVMVDILRETAEAGHGPDIKRFYRCWNTVEKKRLLLAQAYYKESRLIKIKGAGNEIHVRNFRGADLHGNVDVKLELDSGPSTTHAGRTQVILDLLRYGLFNPEMTHPEVRREILRRLGLSGFPDHENIHAERAEYENSLIATGDEEAWKRIAVPPTPVVNQRTGERMVLFEDHYDPVFRMDDDKVHLAIHDKFIFSKEFYSLDFTQQSLAIAHRDLHMAALEAKAEEAAAKAGDMEALAGGGAEAAPPEEGPPPAPVVTKPPATEEMPIQ